MTHSGDHRGEGERGRQRYRDTAEPWADGQLIPMRTVRADIERESTGKLLLRPR